ncbi:MAG: LEA type 2 family protein [Deltaproteobacteria bacterium]|nr:LEA type 2 family protein [Deltaproteobacteria bacterium]
MRPKSATVAQVCPNRIRIRLEADLFNDNPAGANVHQIQLDLMVGGKKLPQINEKLALYIPKKEWTTLAVGAWVPAADIPSLLIAPTLFRDMPYEARGRVWGHAAGSSFSKDFVLTGTIPRNELFLMAQKSMIDQSRSPIGWCAH